MSFAVLANLLTMIFCFAVLVQSMRMLRSLRAVKASGLADVVAALDKATAEARRVLSAMKSTLGTDCAENARLVADARGLRDELSVMIGIADSTAERIVGAVGMANAPRPDAATTGRPPAQSKSKAKAKAAPAEAA